MPILLLWSHTGAIINTTERVKWFRRRLPELEVADVGKGIHYF